VESGIIKTVSQVLAECGDMRESILLIFADLVNDGTANDNAVTVRTHFLSGFAVADAESDTVGDFGIFCDFGEESIKIGAELIAHTGDTDGRNAV